MESGRRRIRDTWPLRKHDVGLLVLCYVGITAVFCVVGYLVKQLDDTGVGRGDERIEQWLADRRTPRLNSLSLFGSMMAETAVKIVITAVVGGVLLWVFKRWFETLIIAVSLILEAMVFITVTYIVERPRPDVPRLDGSPVVSSFPSGHTAAAVCYGAMALVVLWHTRRRWLRMVTVVLAILVPVIVGASRMYRGMHHLTDVVAGAIIGAASVYFVVRIVSAAENRRLAARGDASVAELERDGVPHRLGAMS